MNLKLVYMFMTVICFICVHGQDKDEQNEDNTDNSREIREYNPDSWHAVENYSPQDTSGWIPHDSSSDTNNEQLPRRRRLRKRKRRPIISITDDTSDETSSERVVIRRRLRPLRLDQLREPWEEMDEEIIRRPYVRRRIAPTYEPPEDDIIKSSEQINNNPVSATMQLESESTTEKFENEVISNVEVKDEISVIYGTPQKLETPELSVEEEKVIMENYTSQIPDLKTLLKQNSGTLSLSELLQQKNLSLSELLTGNQKAISALTEKPEPITELPTEPKSTTKFKRLPPSIGLKKTEKTYSSATTEPLTIKETIEAQRKRLALLNGYKEIKAYTDVTKFEVIAEPTTDKRIFVPSHPKYYTSLDYRPDLKHIDPVTEPYVDATSTTTTTLTTTTSTTPTTTSPPITTVKELKETFKPKYNLPMTNSKLTKLITKHLPAEDTESRIPPKSLKTNKDQYNLKIIENQSMKQEPKENNNAPLRMSFDLTSFVKEDEIETEKHPETSTTPQTTEKLKHVTAKEEIMEILDDPASRDRLAKILEIRNMTVEELVAQRERGSSQLHLADIFHNKTREPEPIDEAFIGHVNANFTDFPIFSRQQKSMANNEKPAYKPPELVGSVLQLNLSGDKNNEPISNSVPKEEYTVTSFPTYKIALNKSAKESFQWPELYPSLFPKIYENKNKNSNIDNGIAITENYYENDIQRLEEIENKLSSLSSDRFNVELNQKNYQEEEEPRLFSFPSGVKSAIIASFAIIGASLIVFITILLIFRWTQKHRQRLNYCSSFSSRIKSPILENVPKRTIRSFMNETLGKKKNDYYNYNKSHIQSMSDEMWENDRKPY